MTKDEFGILLKAMRDIYDRPGFLDTDSKKTMWYRLLEDLSYEDAARGLYAFMESPSGRYEPKPADIRTYAVKMQPKGDCPTETEALAMVVKAVRNGIYGAEDEYAKLPPAVQKAVGSPAMLTEWATTPSDSAEVWHSNFLRTYRAVAGRIEHERALPEKMRAYTNLIGTNGTQIGQKNVIQIDDWKMDHSPKGNAMRAIAEMREKLEAGK